MWKCQKLKDIKENYHHLILKKTVTLNIDDPVYQSSVLCTIQVFKVESKGFRFLSYTQKQLVLDRRTPCLSKPQPT